MTETEPTLGPGVDVHLRDLRAFLAVAEHLHFSRAAEALFTSQPALSKQVKALETTIRAKLFTRDRRSVSLTDAGTAFLPGARATLAAWSHAQDDLAAAIVRTRGQLLVGLSLGVERNLLPRVREQLKRLAPGTDLRLHRMPWSDQTSGLAPATGSQVDAAFVWLPLTSPERYEWLSVAKEPRWLLMSSRHPLANRDDVAFPEIADEPFLALPADAGPAREYWLGSDARHGRPAPVSGEAASSEELVEALGAGVGVCLIAEGNLETFRRDSIAAVRVTQLAPCELVLAWRRPDVRPQLRAFVEAVRLALHDK